MDAQTLALKLPQQKLEWKSFSSLAKLLKLSPPAFGRNHFRQLEFIERHLANADPPCQSVLIERYYIDRDFMDDYSAFYSADLYAYPNWCQRIHYFSLGLKQVRKRFDQLTAAGATSGITESNPEEFKKRVTPLVKRRTWDLA